MSKVYLGSDHAGYELKEHIKDYFQQAGIEYVDLGTFSEESVDYPDIAREVGEKVSEHASDGARGILICGTGLGMCIAANKIKGIRATSIMNQHMAEMARKHNDANIVCLGGRIITIEEAKKLVDIFLKTPFEEEERHVRRVKKLE